MAENKTFVRPPISTFRQILLSFFWFSTNMLWSAILLITMPYQVKAAVGNSAKARNSDLFSDRRIDFDADRRADLWCALRPHSSPRWKTQTLGRDRNCGKCNWFGCNGLSHPNRTPQIALAMEYCLLGRSIL